MTKSSTIDLSYNIYPLYSFEGSNTQGDFYVVEGTITVHNAGMYNGKWIKKHGGVRAHLCAYYMYGFQIETQLVDDHGVAIPDVSFPAGATPVPESTIGSTSYTSGFTWGLNGSFTGGVSSGKPAATGTFGFSLSWNNSETRQISDLSITKSGSNGSVIHTLDLKNLPTKYSKRDDDIPSIAIGDLTLHQTWVWYIPSTTDYSTETFNMRVKISKAAYYAWHWYMAGGGDFDLRTFNATGDFDFTVGLTAPSRVPTGQLTVVNSSQTHHYVEDIKIWNWNSENSYDTDPDYTITQTIISSSGSGTTEGSSASIWLPVGKYHIEATRYNLDTEGNRTDQMTVETIDSREISLAETTVVDCGSGEFTAK